MKEIAISAVISTVISVVILNFGERIGWWFIATVDNATKWLSQKFKK